MDPSNDSEEPEVEGSLSPLWVRVTAGAVICVALAAVLVLFYSSRACSEKVATDGEVVDVCRQMTASDPPMVAVGVVALVALTAFFTEIAGFGVSLKREVRALRKKSEAADSKATAAQTSSAVAEDVALQNATLRGAAPISDDDVRLRIEQLAVDYNEIRAAGPTSAARSRSLTGVVSRMLAELSGVAAERVPIRDLLEDGDNDGHRVAAYAYLYANPMPALATALVQAILADPTRFGQYWGIRALSRAVQRDPGCLDFNSQRDLEGLLASLGPSTDRAYELRRLLDAAPRK